MNSTLHKIVGAIVYVIANTLYYALMFVIALTLLSLNPIPIIYSWDVLAWLSGF